MQVCIRLFVMCVVCVVAAGPAAAQSGEVVLHASAAAVSGNWKIVADASAASGSRLANTDHKAPKLTTALAYPIDYFELTFQASAGVGYRLWLRGKAAADAYANDSVHVQFSDSVTATGAASYRIGSSASTVYTIEDCSGCGVSGWGWNDNYYGSTPGALIYFAASGSHTIRVQIREDGISLDQIVLSPAQYRSTSPGTAKNDGTRLAASGTAPSPIVVPPPGPVPSPANLPPVFEAGTDGFRIAALKGSTAAPVTVLATASAFGPETTDTLTYTWRFGDGTAAVSNVQTSEPSRQNAVHLSSGTSVHPLAARSTVCATSAHL